MGQVHYVIPPKVKEIVDDYLDKIRLGSYPVLSEGHGRELTRLVNDELQRLQLIPPKAQGVPNRLLNNYLSTLGIWIMKD